MNNAPKLRRKLLTVLSYEFRKMAFNRTFVITTLLGPFLIAALTVLPSLATMKTMGRSGASLNVGILAEDPSARANVDYLLVPAFRAKGWKVKVSSDRQDLRSEVLGKKLDGYLEIPPSFPKEVPAETIGWYAKNSTDVGVFGAVESAVSDLLVSARIAAAGMDEVYVRSLVKPLSLSVYKISDTSAEGDAQTGEGDFLAVFFTALGFCMLMYMTVLIYGQQIGRSVVSEKSSKIVDVLLSSVRSEDLLYGKILGIGLAGLTQYAVWTGLAALILGVVGPAFHLEIPSSVGMDKLFLLVLFFVGGYLLYASIYSACGAASEDDQHMAQLALPVVFVLVIPMLLIQVFIQQPDSAVSVILSYVPLTSPMVMIVRSLVSPVAWWHVALSLGILAVSVLAAGKLAAKIFRTGILMTGRNFTFRDIALWLRS